MSSSYSPDLRFELIANGEQSGVWGNTTNNNIGTLVEQAIAGTASVTVTSTNYALSVYNGVSDQSRNAVISLSTTTGAPFNVYIPPVSKLYVLVNTTSYSASVYASTVAGNTTAAGSGVSLAANSRSFVYCDGTNVYDAINHVSGNFFTEGNLQVSGTTTLGGNPTLALQAATKQYVDAGVAATIPSGALMMWSTASSPSGWLICNGAAVSRTTYAALYAVIGITFGAGDGSTTFNIPNYQDRMPIGKGTIASAIGSTGGSKDATLVSHTHTASVSDPGHTHSLNNGTNVIRDGSPRNRADGSSVSLNISTLSIASNTTGISVSNSTEGSSATNANMPPYLGINFIIKT